MFKVVSALGAVALITTLAACGGSNDKKAAGPAAEQTTIATTAHKSSPTKTKAKGKAASAAATTTVQRRVGFATVTTAPGTILMPAVPTGSQITLPPGVGVSKSRSNNNGSPQSPGTTVKPYNPSDGIDLSGTPGVTAAQQHAAEQLLPRLASGPSSLGQSEHGVRRGFPHDW